MTRGAPHRPGAGGRRPSALDRAHAQLLEHVARRRVGRLDLRDDARRAEHGERVRDQRAAELGRVAAPPGAARERVAELDVVAQRVQPAVADERAAVALGHREEREPAALEHLAVDAQRGGGLRHRPVRAVADVAHHVGIGVDGVDRVAVGRGERPQVQPLRRQLHVTRPALRSAARRRGAQRAASPEVDADSAPAIRSAIAARRRSTSSSSGPAPGRRRSSTVSPAAQLARSLEGVRQRAREEAPTRLPALRAPDRFHVRPTPLPWLGPIMPAEDSRSSVFRSRKPVVRART